MMEERFRQWAATLKLIATADDGTVAIEYPMPRDELVFLAKNALERWPPDADWTAENPGPEDPAKP